MRFFSSFFFHNDIITQLYIREPNTELRKHSAKKNLSKIPMNLKENKGNFLPY